jgi:hypothetical protein
MTDWRGDLLKIGIIPDDMPDQTNFVLFNLDELANHMIKELDKAREEVLIELQKEFSEFGVPDDVRYTQPLFYINEVIEKKLSKLKTKEDGK